MSDKGQACAFCCAEDACCTYTVTRPLMTLEPVSGLTINLPSGAWNACDGCSNLIDADQYERLARKATEAWERGCDTACAPHDTHRVRAYYSVLFGDFAEARGTRQSMPSPSSA
jgi:hypothetical protein